MDYLIIIFALIIGISAILTSLKLVKLYFKIGGWKRVEAKVISKEVAFNSLSNSPRTPYTVLVEYVYRFENKEYHGNKLDLVELIGGFSTYRKLEAEKRMSRIKEIEMVYVNPEDNAQSLMNRNGITLYLIVFVVGTASILFGLVKII